MSDDSAAQRDHLGALPGDLQPLSALLLLTGHLVTLPNDQLARSYVENVGRRPYIRRMADIHLPLDTSRESMEKALAIIRSALEKHDGMDPDFPPRAFFTDYLPTAFNIRVIYWYNPPSYWDFLDMSEKVNLGGCPV